MEIETAAVLTGFAQAIAAFVIGTGVLQNLIYLAQLGLAAAALIQAPSTPQSGLLWRRYADASPPIALLAPAGRLVETFPAQL